jgi:FHA domain
MLNAAYGEGLLSDDTFARRVDQVLTRRLLDPTSLIGDLHLRRGSRRRTGLGAAVSTAVSWLTGAGAEEPASPVLLGLDWTGGQTELMIGRHHACDVVLEQMSVSRRHARLVFRDAKWILQDLESRNGTLVNGTRVGRCELRPGDHLRLGDAFLKVD